MPVNNGKIEAHESTWIDERKQVVEGMDTPIDCVSGPLSSSMPVKP